MKEINPKDQAIYFNKAKRIHVAVDWNAVLHDRSKVMAIPVLKSSSTNKWMQIGTQSSDVNVLDLEPLAENELVKF